MNQNITGKMKMKLRYEKYLLSKMFFGCKWNLCMIINAFKIVYRGLKFHLSLVITSEI